MFMGASYWVIFQAILVVFGFWWCKDVVCRLGKDCVELRGEGDLTAKGSIVFFWVLTAGIVMWMYRFLRGLLDSILESF
jgi:hypothetical protein